MSFDFLNHFSYNSPVILTYLIISFVVLIFNQLTKEKSTDKFFATYRSNPKDILMYPRLITHIFGHYGWDHFISNFLCILVIGPMLEEKFGSEKLLLFILITAFSIGIIHNTISKAMTCGASGIVYLFIILSSYVNVEGDKIPLTFVLVPFLFLTKEIITWISKNDKISHAAHIVGGLVGIVIILLMNNNLI